MGKITKALNDILTKEGGTPKEGGTSTTVRNVLAKILVEKEGEGTPNEPTHVLLEKISDIIEAEGG